MNSFGLSEEHDQFLKNLFTKHLGNLKGKIWIFGSRATGTFQKYSDIDLLIDCPQLTAQLLSKISEELEESSFPYKVDLVDLRKLAPEYAAGVQAEKRLFHSLGSDQ